MPGTTDTVKAMLTPGEFVIRKEAVDMIGVPILKKLNDMPEAGGHSEIDRLIAKATLKNMTGMYGGGMVNAKQYMGGGKVDMYGHGGKVKNQMMMGYEHGGEAHGNLKPVPDDNPGLAKLPEAVRNKMGYMQEGGSVLNMALRRAEPMQLNPEFVNVDYELKEDPSGSSANIQNLGYFLDLQRKYTDEANIYRKALEPFNKAQYEGLGKPVDAIEEWANRVNPDIGDEGDARDKLLFRKLKRADKKLQQAALTSNRQMGQMIYQANQDKPIVGNFDQPLKDYTKASKEFEGLLREIIRRPIASKALDKSFDNSSRQYYNRFGNPFYGDYDSSATGERYDMQNPERFLDYKGQPVLDVFEDGGLIGMMKGGEAKKKKKYGYQRGGSVKQTVNKLVPYLAYSDGGEKQRNVTLKAYANPSDSTVFYQHYYQPFLYDRSGKISGFVDKKGDRHFHTTKKLLDMAKSMSDDDFDYTNIGSIANKYFDLEGKKYADFKFPGMQEGGAVQDDAMMLQYLQSLQAQQANPFVPFDQRPPSSGEMMSPIPSGMEQGDMMRIIRDEREVLDMQDAELLRQKAQNALTRFQLDSLMEKATLDSLINQGSGDAMKIQRSPNEPFSFPNTPAQENFMQKYKEEMIDPTYFPEGS